MGLVEHESIICLSDDEWGILEEIDEVKVNLNKTFCFFENGIRDC